MIPIHLTRFHKLILLVAAVLLSLSVLFPIRKWSDNAGSGARGVETPDRAFLYSPHIVQDNRIEIALDRMLLEWMLIVFAAAGAIVMASIVTTRRAEMSEPSGAHKPQT